MPFLDSPSFRRLRTFLRLFAQGSFSRAKNYLLTHINMIRRPEYATNYPTILIVDPVNVCNLSCGLCITGQKKSLRPPKLLSFREFKKIIDELGKWAIRLDLYNWGEPFLNKEIFDMITYAKMAGLRVEVSSNLNIFNQEVSEKIIKSKLDKLIISLHGANPKTYSKYMWGGNFNRVIDNIKLLIKAKKKLKSRLPETVWRFLVTSFSEKEIEKAKKLSNNLGVDSFEALPVKLDVGFNPNDVEKNIKKNACWLPKDKNYCLYNLKKDLTVKRQITCLRPWEITSINPDGTIQPCCVFANPSFDFGNIFKTPFIDIWNGEKYRTARKVIKEKIKNDQSTICGLCVASNFIVR